MDEVVAEVLPAQKLDVVRAEQAAGRTVMMVGDGVNDAPALGGADVGVAIGAELNEVALGGADVALLGTDLGRLPAAHRSGRHHAPHHRPERLARVRALGGPHCAGRAGSPGSPHGRSVPERGRSRRRRQQRSNPAIRGPTRIGTTPPRCGPHRRFAELVRSTTSMNRTCRRSRGTAMIWYGAVSI